MTAYVTHCHHTHHAEKFEPLTLHQSLLTACRMVRAYEGEAHITAQRVCEKVIEWLEDKTEVTSRDIHRIAKKYLTVYHPDAAYMYDRYEEIL